MDLQPAAAAGPAAAKHILKSVCVCLQVEDLYRRVLLFRALTSLTGLSCDQISHQNIFQLYYHPPLFQILQLFMHWVQT